MRYWYQFGAFGSTVIELSWKDLWRLIRGKEIEIAGNVLCFGKSKRKSLYSAPSREQQVENAGRV